MISQQEITFWRAHAPWSDDLMVEQDYLISQAVALIFDDKFLRAHIAMRGGTVLHNGHLAPASRYSEDINLVRVTERPPGLLFARCRLTGLRDWIGEPKASLGAWSEEEMVSD